MSLNIKNERVHALVREAARRTGKNQTSVIEEALERLLADLDLAETAERDRRRERALDWYDRRAGSVTDGDRRAMREFERDMYDESGLST